MGLQLWQVLPGGAESWPAAGQRVWRSACDRPGSVAHPRSAAWRDCLAGATPPACLPSLSPCPPLQNAQWQAPALVDRSSSAAVPVWEALSINFTWSRVKDRSRQLWLWMQVAWQGLLDVSAEGSVSDDSGTGKASIAAAVLTHRRLLIVSATLTVLCVHVPSAAEPAITSFLWLGPALLFCNAAHQVPAVMLHVLTICCALVISSSLACHGLSGQYVGSAQVWELMHS